MNGFSPGHPSTHSVARSLRLLGFVALCLLALPLVLRAAAPGWWTERGVINASLTANDFAALNQGQVKNLAQKAMQELDDHLPGGGAGEEVHAAVDAWAVPTATTDDYSPVKLGALKALAQPFYRRLIEVGYAGVFPWAGKEEQANNYAAANIGQAKNLFSFDVTHDSDHNNLPDWWEQHWFGQTGVDPNQMVDWGKLSVLQAYQQGLNPHDFYNGRTPVFKYISGDEQHGAPNEFLDLPLIVAVTDGNGKPLSNAPVKFAVTRGNGRVQKLSSSVPDIFFTVLADNEGQAKIYFRLSSDSNDANQVTAAPGSGNYPASVTFNAFADRPPSGGGAFAPTNFVSLAGTDGSLDMSWSNNPDNDDPIEVEIRRADGSWRLIATLPAGTTSYHWPSH